MPIRLTRTVSFRALHRLYRSDWSDEENHNRFGWTATAPGHPHVYRCAVTVTGPVDERLAMVMDLPALDGILRDEVVDRFDGRLLNELPPFDTVLPTCEAIARDAYRRIAARLPDRVELARVRIAEDDTLHADCTGP
jgi:6-pyruvoyltetrahydropterin/6-carboxytetrahydropterin synthase